MKRWRLGLFSCFLILGISGWSREKKSSPEYIDSLNAELGVNKRFDSLMHKPALLALAHYPELRTTHIEYRYKKLPTLMAARPAFDFLFRSSKKRRYIIFISNNPENNSRQLFRNMSLTAKTGILGHEYAHILEYEKLSNLGMLWYSVNYFMNRRKIERETDRMAIERGLGNEMLEYTTHIKTSQLISRITSYNVCYTKLLRPCQKL